jgi:protein-S-isoprenylcysteine O-methyltransferase Ste14
VGPVPASLDAATARRASANNGARGSEYRKPPQRNAQAAQILKPFDQLLLHTHTDMHTLELKIPPLGLVIVAALLMWLGVVYFPTLNIRFPFQSVVAWVIGLFGALACALGVIEFRRAKTTVDPTKPDSASSLVRTGIYRRTRNPMYVGFLLILTGWAAAVTNLTSFLILPAFVVYMNRFQIKPEERALASIFGDDFKAYCAEARRWI